MMLDPFDWILAAIDAYWLPITLACTTITSLCALFVSRLR